MIKLQVIMCPPSIRKDGSAMIKMETQELSPEQHTSLVTYLNQVGWFVFSPNKFQDSDIPKEPAKVEGKSPSKRLYSVLFVEWKQKGEPCNFQQYYENYIESRINEIKNGLI